MIYICVSYTRILGKLYGCTCQFGPRYEGQLTRMTEPIPSSGQSSSYSLTTLSLSRSTDRRAETDRKVITTRIAVAHHFRCRLRRRESCILGATSSQPTLPLHELPPARLVIHRQTSAHERRKGTRNVQSRSSMLAHLCPRQHWLWVTVEPHIHRHAPRGGCCSGGGSLPLCTPSFGLGTTSLRTHRHRGRSRPLRSAVVEDQDPSVAV